ncbi:hypothetical protein C4D60_Mb09t08990 [Musa balbisiana]|uniref:Legume lectin domain-containing protein n=1 Tax=Musa balbisiana TaxID=52838 RepID=A0A4S8IF24_MUSBA|nr:hypothetical protein C4D60_Mb09t08990 [Musa balbisiana]
MEKLCNMSAYLGLFNQSSFGNSNNHVLAIEIDTIYNPEFLDIDDNHVGIDINSVKSSTSHVAGYYADDTGSFTDLSLRSEKAMQVWIEYDGHEMLLNVTMAPIPMAKPHKPLLSATIDLSSVLLSDPMYVGFSSSTGSFKTSHYVLGWSFRMNGVAEPLDCSLLPSLPLAKSNGKSKVLDIVLPLASAGLAVIIAGIIVFMATTITDVFAFGVFLLEVACGRRPVDSVASGEELILLDWVVENWRKGSILATRDPRLGNEYVMEEVELVLKLGLLCSHPLPTGRPSMRQVVEYLEGEAALPELSPTYLGFSVLALLHNEGFDDYIMSYPSSMATSSAAISGACSTASCHHGVDVEGKKAKSSLAVMWGR